MTISFRPLELSDLDDFHVWLNRPHLRRFYQRKPVSRDEVEAHYGPCIRGEDPAHFARHGGRPLVAMTQGLPPGRFAKFFCRKKYYAESKT